MEENVVEPDSKKTKVMDSSDLKLDDFIEDNDPTAEKFLQIAKTPVSFINKWLILWIRIVLQHLLIVLGFHPKCLKSWIW